MISSFHVSLYLNDELRVAPIRPLSIQPALVVTLPVPPKDLSDLTYSHEIHLP